jgi:predicted alpha/beta-fold hydrolase
MVRTAQKYGFKCGTVLFKGAEDLPITSGKFNVSCCWEDASQISTYVHDKYVINSKTGLKQCNFYAYGCSLGAGILNLMLVNEAEDTKYDAVGLYGNVFD